MPHEPSSNPQRILAVVCGVTVFGVLNASAVTVVLPQMGETLGANSTQLGWIVSIFLLVYGVAIPFYGRLADRFGERDLFLGGLLLFGVGSLACALAPTVQTMLVARVVQGVGGAAFPGLGMTLASRAFPPAGRGVALGAIAATMGVGGAVGPLVGGVLADVASWRLLFGISALATAVFPFARAVLPRSAGAGAGRLDLVGGGLLAVGIAAALFALAEGGTRGWSSPVVVAALVSSGVAFVGLVRHQGRTADPFLPPVLLRDRTYLRIVAMGFFTTGTYLGTLIGLPLLLARVHGLSPFQVGLTLMPGAVATGLMGLAAGRLVDRIGARVPTLAGSGILILAALGFSTVAGTSHGAVVVLVVALGTGYALINTPLAATISNRVGPDVLASALSLNIMVFFTGGSFGTTAFVVISEARAGAAQAWNPLYGGASVAFSDAFGLFALPMALVAILAALLPAARARGLVGR